MEPIIFVRKKRNKSSGRSEVVRIDSDVYNDLAKIFDETGVPVQKIASRLLREAFEFVKVVDEDDLETS